MAPDSRRWSRNPAAIFGVVAALGLCAVASAQPPGAEPPVAPKSAEEYWK